MAFISARLSTFVRPNSFSDLSISERWSVPRVILGREAAALFLMATAARAARMARTKREIN